MAASFPTSIKSFTTKVDNVTDVLAAHINDLQDEVVAIETALGVSWAGHKARAIFTDGSMLDCANATPAAIDNTKPQSTEGDQIMTTTYTPKTASSRLRITVRVNGCFESTNQGLIWLLKDSDTDALAVSSMCGIPGVLFTTGIIVYEYVPGSTSLITFKVRAGQPSTGYRFTFNGVAAAAKLNGTLLSSIIIDEF